MTKKRHTPIESFGPEILAALIKGSKEPVVIRFPTYRQAYSFTMRLSQLKAQMLLQKHALGSVVQRAKPSLDWGQHLDPPVATKYGHHKTASPINHATPTTCTISPRDSEFEEALKAAGITPAELKRDVLDDVPTSPQRQDEHDFLDQFMTKEEH